MSKVTKTLNPLHFEDLEPHRFEDLVRQLIYDFRDWRSLEPTGRLGSDDGYDARGFEIVGGQTSQEIEKDEEDGEQLDEPSFNDRLWQLQCKREKTITPAKLAKYVDEMIPKGADIPYGVIFTAPCDFSKKTRDVFIEKMREKKVQEFYLWGRGDLEDMLMQPKNDHLLYAYFGISLVIRRRTRKTELRSLIATKRKAVKHLGPIGQNSFTSVLIREASDTKYPYKGEVPNFKEKPSWKMYMFLGHTHEGIRVLVRRFFAYREIDPATGKLLKWDYTKEVNLALQHGDFWNKEDEDGEGFQRGHAFLDKMEAKNQAFFEIEGIIPYERIIEIDPFGDELVHQPHIYVEQKNNTFWDYSLTYLASRNSYGSKIPMEREDEKTRISFFPKKLPKLPKPKPLPPMGSGKKKSSEGTSQPKIIEE